MAATIYRLAEQSFNLIEGGAPAVASSIGMNELKIAVGQVINQLLKTEHFTINEKMGERIPNGSVLGWYEGIECSTWNGVSKATLPIKPIKLPRNMGVYGVYPKKTSTSNYDVNSEFIPLQMGQAGQIGSQRLLNGLLGQVGYEVFGLDVVFTKDITAIWPGILLAMRLVILDISQYGDYDVLPILPEQEWQVVQEVYKLYASQVVPDKVVDSTVKELKNIPLIQQKASE